MQLRALQTRNRLLDAADDLVQREGAARLTLEAVAAEAGVSKGGLLYHFPSKEALITALLERRFQRFEEAWRARMAADPDPRGRAVRAYLHVTLEDPDPAAAGLLAAVATDPALLAPLQAQYRSWQREIAADPGLTPAEGTLLRLAIDGLWFCGLMGFAPPDPDLRAAIAALVEIRSRPGAAEEAAP